MKYLSEWNFSYGSAYNLRSCVICSKGGSENHHIISSCGHLPDIPEIVHHRQNDMSEPTNKTGIKIVSQRLNIYAQSEGADAPNAQILRNNAAIFIAPGRTFESFYQGLLALVNPRIIRICKTEASDKEQPHHLTECASFSSTTLMVVHENRTSEGKPNVGSTDFLIQAWVFGSVQSRDER